MQRGERPLPATLLADFQPIQLVHRLANLAKDIAAGLSILLLQPVLPTVVDLEVELEARGTATGTAPELRGTSRTRFEYTWIRAPKESIEQWHRKATDRAIDELIARIVDHYGHRTATETPGS